MQIKKHPYFLVRWKRYFLGFALYFIVSLCGIIYFGNHGFSSTVEPILPLFLLSFIALFGYGIYLTKRVTCASCGAKITGKSISPEIPDSWSAYCSTCDTLWDLELGNQD